MSKHELLSSLVQDLLNSFPEGENHKIDLFRKRVLSSRCLYEGGREAAASKSSPVSDASSATQLPRRIRNVSSEHMRVVDLMSRLLQTLLTSDQCGVLPFHSEAGEETIPARSVAELLVSGEQTDATTQKTASRDTLTKATDFQVTHNNKQGFVVFGCPIVFRLLTALRRHRRAQGVGCTDQSANPASSPSGAQPEQKSGSLPVQPMATDASMSQVRADKSLELEWAKRLVNAVETWIVKFSAALSDMSISDSSFKAYEEFTPIVSERVRLSVNQDMAPWEKTGRDDSRDGYLTHSDSAMGAGDNEGMPSQSPELNRQASSTQSGGSTRASATPGFIYLWIQRDYQSEEGDGRETKSERVRKEADLQRSAQQQVKRICRAQDASSSLTSIPHQITPQHSRRQHKHPFKGAKDRYEENDEQDEDEGEKGDDQESKGHICRHSLTPFAMQRGELEEFRFETLGYVDSCFKHKYGAPRQGAVVPSSKAAIVLRHDLHTDALLGLEQYSHVWLVFVFNSNDQKKYLPKIKPPRLGGEKMGWLATRSPHRWNDIGLSVVKLDKVETASRKTGLFKCGVSGIEGCGRLLLSGVDLVDGTPILDIKPYHPSDLVSSNVLRIPKWLSSLPHASLWVSFSQGALRQLASIFETHKQPLQFYDTMDEVKTAIEQVLSMDPRPNCTKTRHTDGIYGFVFDRLNVVYQMKAPKVAVVELIQYRGAPTAPSGVLLPATATSDKMNKSEWLEVVKLEIAKLRLEKQTHQEATMRAAMSQLPPTPDAEAPTCSESGSASGLP